MRNVFSSQRLETVEGVAALLRDHGIDIHVSNPRSYRGGRRGQFSYLERPKPVELPGVWVVHAEDQKRAREVLREAGLIDTTRPNAPFSAMSGMLPTSEPTGASRWAWRMRIALMVGIAIAAIVTVMRYRDAKPAVVSPTPAATTTEAPAMPGVARPNAPEDGDASVDAATDATPATATPETPTPEDDEVRVRIQPSAPTPSRP